MHRSYLFAPDHNAKLLRRVFEAGADAVILDLEDAVPPDAKELAREIAPPASRRRSTASTRTSTTIRGCAIRPSSPARSASSASPRSIRGSLTASTTCSRHPRRSSPGRRPCSTRSPPVIVRARPTVLIGTSTQPGAFSEPVITQMAAHVGRPVIMPLSNPTSRSEAQPADLIAWTGGRALIATGSPFEPVTYGGVRYQIAQANNALIFPGLGLGVTVCRARRISDGMLAAAARALADLSGTAGPGAAILPPVASLRTVSAAVATAVAQAAQAEGLAQTTLDDPAKQVAEAMWVPAYPLLEPA